VVDENLGRQPGHDLASRATHEIKNPRWSIKTKIVMDPIGLSRGM
jgi:hypothetical protein